VSPGLERIEILDAIRRCAANNNGVPLGRSRFEAETGIREKDWNGRYWARWGDALIEAGFEPNMLNQAHPEDHLLIKFVELTRDLGHFPTDSERRLRRRSDPSFPSPNAYTRFGRNADLAARVVTFCSARAELDDVRSICEPLVVRGDVNDEETLTESVPVLGVVYLMRSGAHYKIGRSNAVGRRAYELGIQLPERLELVHAIETDDPGGIERYWHQRFADRRANGEWFKLSKVDVAAFKRRKRFM
jgi:hypothetical protein